MEMDACRFPETQPRIGEQYQVEIPPVLGESDSELYKGNHANNENGAVFPFKYFVGLPIPVIWKKLTFEPIKHATTKFLSESEISSDVSGNLGSWSSRGKCFCLDKDITNIEMKSCDVSAKTESAFATLDTEEKQKQCTCPGFHLIPDSDFTPWTDNEKERIILGLYIFEKNFARVMKFVESKRMGDILSFYYGKLYGSDEYQRWSDGRKNNSKKVVLGENIFTGAARQQELLSRLLPSVSEKCRNGLFEVAKTFEAGRMSLEEFVFTLKAIVGTNSLIEAVGIGKRKKDLTRFTTIDFSRFNQGVPMRSEIPTTKALADLDPCEIIKFLRGDYRLSKARANDLFWEAVWPRLLARGWQSLQPKNESKDSLVFLVTGVEKFSRKKLVKGKQYYDSVTDILSKVASEPKLLELDSEDHKDGMGTNHEGTPDKKEEINLTPSRKCHLYLQPRKPSRSSCGIKFTIVDTSLAGDKPYKVKELRELLFDLSSKTTISGHIEFEEKSTSELSSDESGTVNAMLVDQTNTARASFLNEYAKMPSNVTNSILPQSKRLRGSSFMQPDTCSTLQFCPSEPKITNPCSENGGFVNDDSSLSVSSQDKVSSTTTSHSFHNEWTEGAVLSDAYVEHLAENKQDMGIIDSSIPQVPHSFGSGSEDIDDHIHHKPDLKRWKISSHVATSQQQHEVVKRRHSTRSRPPTAKVLEALACGFDYKPQATYKEKSGVRRAKALKQELQD